MYGRAVSGSHRHRHRAWRASRAGGLQACGSDQLRLGLQDTDSNILGSLNAFKAKAVMDAHADSTLRADLGRVKTQPAIDE